MPLGEIFTVNHGLQKFPANRPGRHARTYLRVTNLQRGIVDMVNRQRQRIAEERSTTEERQAKAAREVEEMILGICPVK